MQSSPGASQTQPNWIRIWEVVVGLVTIVFGISVLFFPGLGIATLILLLSVGLLFSGARSITRMALGMLPRGIKAISGITGIVTLVLGLVVILFPGTGALTLVFILAYGLISYGIGRLYLAYSLKASYAWVRGLVAAVGVVNLVACFIVLAYPGLALLTLTVILAVILLFVGAESLILGASGRS